MHRRATLLELIVPFVPFRKCCLLDMAPLSRNIFNLANLLSGSAYIFIRRVSSEVRRRVFDAAAPAEHGPVPSNHSASGGLPSAATPPPPPPAHLPDNGQRTPDKLV